MKLSLVSVELDADLQWAVTVPSDRDDVDAPPSVLAVFAYADAATRWGDENYKGRFKVVRAVSR